MIETTLYGGRLNIKHNPESRVNRYAVELDGEKVNWESVTGVTGIKDKSRPLQIYATDLARDYLIGKFPNITEEDVLTACKLFQERKEEAANIGTKIHGWVENHIRHTLGAGEHPDMPEDSAVQIGVNAYMDFEDQHKIKYHSVERIVASLEHQYTGRLDIEATIDNRHGLLDLKSSNGLYNEVRMQTAGYVKADEEERGKKIYRVRWAVRVAKETEDEYKVRMEKKGKVVFPPYQVFEAMNLDEERYRIDEDYEAFIGANILKKWDGATDFYTINKNK